MSMFSGFNQSKKTDLTPQLAFNLSNFLAGFTSSTFLDESEGWIKLPYLLPSIRFKNDGDDTEEYISEMSAEMDKYINKHELFNGNKFDLDALNDFLANAGAILNHEQKLAILINVCDLLLLDGEVEEDEQAIFELFLEAFEVTQEEFQPHLKTLMLKHDRSLF